MQQECTSRAGCLALALRTKATLAVTTLDVVADVGSNEITAIPRLLDLLDLHGCIVTIDAIGCQQDIAQQIVAQ